MRSIIILALIACLTGCSAKNTEITGLEGKPMPNLNLLLVDSITHLTTNNIPRDKPVIMMFISPFCPYCQAQTEDIVANIKLLDNVRIYILTDFPLSSLREYINRNHLDKYSGITVAQNYDSQFLQYFKVIGVPYIAIYNKDKLLKEVRTGKTDVKLLRKSTL